MSRPGELHPQPLVERYVNLSAHTTPIRRTHLSSRSACLERRCCVNRNWHRALPRVGSSPIDREGLWSTKLGHSIEHVARTHRFDSLGCASPTSKSIAENRLVPEERVLDAGLSMIADLLLPSTAPNLADPADRPIASARPRVASGQLGGLRRRHDDGRAAGVGCLVEGERVVAASAVTVARCWQWSRSDRWYSRHPPRRSTPERRTRLVDSQMKRRPRRPCFAAAHSPSPTIDRRAVDEEVQGGIVKLPTSARFSPWALSARVSVSRHT